MKIIRLLKKYTGLKHYILACVIFLLLCGFKLSAFLTSPQPEIEYDRKKIVFDVTVKQLDRRGDELDRFSYEDKSLVKDRDERPPITGVSKYEKTENEILFEDEVIVESGIVKLTSAGRKIIEKDTHVLAMQDSFRKRLSKIRHKCRNNTDGSVDLSRIIYNDKHKFIMCDVPNAASSTWKRLWWHLSGYEGYQKVSGDKLVLNHGYITTLSEVPVSEALLKLKEYTRFFIKRNPLERIVSAHRSKFTSLNKIDGYYKHGLGIKAANKYLPTHVHNIEVRNFVGVDFEDKLKKSIVYQSLPKGKQNQVHSSVIALNVGEINFDIFTKMVIADHESGRKVDVHWRNQVDLCSPCVINYDYVIDFNHLHDESNRLLNYLQRSDQEQDKVSFGKRQNRTNSDTIYKKLHSLPKERRSKLLQLYERDFDVLYFSDLNV